MRPRGHGKIGAPRQVHNVFCAPGAGRDQPTAPRQSRADDPRFGMMPFHPETRAKPETFHRMYGCHSGTHFGRAERRRTPSDVRLPTRESHKPKESSSARRPQSTFSPAPKCPPAPTLGTCIALDRGPTIALRKQQRRNLKPDVLLVVGLFGGFFPASQLSVTGSRDRSTMCLAHREQGEICRPRRGRVGQMILASE